MIFHLLHPKTSRKSGDFGKKAAYEPVQFLDQISLLVRVTVSYTPVCALSVRTQCSVAVSLEVCGLCGVSKLSTVHLTYANRTKLIVSQATLFSLVD